MELAGLFSNYGAFMVGSFELLTSVILILPALTWLFSLVGGSGNVGLRPRLHQIGGGLAAVVMAGAVFLPSVYTAWHSGIARRQIRRRLPVLRGCFDSGVRHNPVFYERQRSQVATEANIPATTRA